MKAYKVLTSKIIEPFNDSPKECLIMNKPLFVIQQEVISKLGYELCTVCNKDEIDDPNEYIVFSEDLYFTYELLEEFIARSRKYNSITTCALNKGTLTLRSVSALQEVKEHNGCLLFDLKYVPSKADRGNSIVIVINPDEFKFGLPFPGHMCKEEKYLIPITSKILIQINHWTNLWAANVISTNIEIARFMKKSRLYQILNGLKSFSFNKWTILHNLNKIGKDCDIHPAAYIEGSMIGDNVTIGAGSIIRESVIGEGSYIGNSVTIEGSVVGQNCTIISGHILYCAIYPSVFSVTHMISASLIGNDVFIGSGVILTDYRLDGKDVTVMRSGEKLSTKNEFIGSCIGHETRLGSGCIVAPGRSIPSGLNIVPNKDKIIHELSTDMRGYRCI